MKSAGCILPPHVWCVCQLLMACWGRDEVCWSLKIAAEGNTRVQLACCCRNHSLWLCLAARIATSTALSMPFDLANVSLPA